MHRTVHSICHSICACWWLAIGSASHAASSIDESSAIEVARLSVQVQRTQALRDIKQLHDAYSQFAEFGMWDEAAALLTDRATWTDGERVLQGRRDIEKDWIKQAGGKLGLPPGSLRTELYISPVITVSADGLHAQGRWQTLNMRGQFGVDAHWSGGMEETQYRKENNVWKISAVRSYPQFAGSYEQGFFALKPELPLIPYHYTTTQAGQPVAPLAGEVAALKPNEVAAVLQQSEQRVAVMNAQDEIRNLQNSYGYYIDRKLWDDVTDLFTRDGALEIAGVGIYDGVNSIRRALERDGPAGLQRGQVNDHMQMQAIITVAPNGVEASARGVEIGVLTPKLGEAYWSMSIFENRYVKQDGVWRIREMRLFPRMKADYYQGWAKSSIVDAVPGAPYAPDRASPADSAPQRSNALPVFAFKHPVTGKSIKYPAGTRVVGEASLLPAWVAPSAANAPNVSMAERVRETQRRMNLSLARDSVENVSDAFAFYLDDFQWQSYVEVYAEQGRRQKTCCGFYIGRDHIFKAEAMSYGPMPMPRDWIRLHTRLQPVIHVAADGKSAYLRTRMWLYYANAKNAGAWNSGMYPNESAVLENGVWKLNVGGGVDEPYFQSPSYQEGWAKIKPEGAGATAGPFASRGAATPRRPSLPNDFPPDLAISAMGRRGEGFARELPNYITWPDIKPMWFHYLNPVSGRRPSHYCPDITTCFLPGGEANR